MMCRECGASPHIMNRLPLSCPMKNPLEYGTQPSTNMSEEDRDNGEASFLLPPRQIPTHHPPSHQHALNVTTNILEWYAFAVFGYLSDVMGDIFFPGSKQALLKSFAVFGGAFLVRPLGGIVFGYLGDVHGRRHVALIQSILLMGLATTAMAVLPAHGAWMLLGLRLMQGLSAGGQLMSSLVFGVESRPCNEWGWYGSFVLSAANLGNLLAGASVYVLRLVLQPSQVQEWGWRLLHVIPGILLLLCAWLLVIHTSKTPQGEESSLTASPTITQQDAATQLPPNPLKLAFAPSNRRALLAACMVPVLGSAGFWLTFVWMAMYMYKLSPHTIPSAFGLNAVAMFCSIILFFPIAGHWSDVWGRRRVMTMGGIAFGVGSPIGLWVISQGHALWALVAQLTMGTCLALWCAPMAAWLAESFPPELRLTSAAVGYNLGVGIFSGIAPAAATYSVDRWGPQSPGYLLVFVSMIGLVGLWVVAPAPTRKPLVNHPFNGT